MTSKVNSQHDILQFIKDIEASKYVNVSSVNTLIEHFKNNPEFKKDYLLLVVEHIETLLNEDRHEDYFTKGCTFVQFLQHHRIYEDYLTSFANNLYLFVGRGWDLENYIMGLRNNG